MNQKGGHNLERDQVDMTGMISVQCRGGANGGIFETQKYVNNINMM